MEAEEEKKRVVQSSYKRSRLDGYSRGRRSAGECQPLVLLIIE